MDNRKGLYVIFLWLTILGCSTKTGTSPNGAGNEFLSDIPVINMNESLQIRVDGTPQIFHFGSEIPLLIYNESPVHIHFDGEGYLKLFILGDGKWAEIDNELTYSGSQVLSPAGTALLDQTITWAKPAIPGGGVNDETEALILRIFVIGQIVQNDVLTGENVGAYVDVHISR